VKKRNRSGARTKKLLAKAAADKAEQHRLGAYGPADLRPDGSMPVARMDAISYMARNNQLPSEEEAAALEIMRVYTSICHDVFAKVQTFERVNGGTQKADEARDIDAARRYREFTSWSASHLKPRNLQIGRASCRERV